MFDSRSRKEFWSNVSPSHNELIQRLEDSENWTITPEDNYALYQKVDEALSSLDATDPDTVQKSLQSLVPVVATLPLKDSIMALAKLNHVDSGKYPWGTALIDFTREAAQADDGGEYQEHAKALHDRVCLFTRHLLVLQLFNTRIQFDPKEQRP
ncbi:type IVB secretion system protein IcmW [Ferrimonas marina]|uniref:Uncharacterized protein n=1 Tax=Ferrimonas marina TaxID=299255 RepID=A0A1M5THT9_9GAMM|nr:hypothetical protein [Ferrimonas marina]SHH50322.1 hypothetical protein SAMN02745129_2151 [Ferrimonas marina]